MSTPKFDLAAVDKLLADKAAAIAANASKNRDVALVEDEIQKLTDRIENPGGLDDQIADYDTKVNDLKTTQEGELNTFTLKEEQDLKDFLAEQKRLREAFVSNQKTVLQDLKNERGVLKQQREAVEKERAVYEGDLVSVQAAAKPGNDIVQGIDAQLQAIAQEAETASTEAKEAASALSKQLSVHQGEEALADALIAKIKAGGGTP